MKPQSSGSGRGVADAMVALVVIAIVATMVVSVPTWALDGLISLNLAASFAVLLLALRVRSAMAMATFPTLLLLTTLYRLALEVAAAKLILGHADAGQVIRAFGHGFVNDNYVVGAVVFAIITLIQLLVISRGGERVAEVAARFVLDALPGRQMAIDAELRAGVVDAREAGRKRHELTRESSFYGAMDGAMKFVKGDAIAGVVIALVNIVGGLAIGVGQQHMAVADALRRYGLLTIGQGLAAQVPAVVVCSAAAILVTRVEGEDGAGSLGRDIGRQFIAEPGVIGASGVLLFGLGVVRGMPHTAFVLMAAVLIGAALALRRRGTGARNMTVAETSRVEPLAVDVGGAAGVTQTAAEESLRVALDALRNETGVPFPAARVSLSRGNDTEVSIRGVRVASQRVAAGDLAGFVVATLRRNARAFVGVQETQVLLDGLESTHPALIRAVIPHALSLPGFAAVLRGLADERVPIRNLRDVLEAIAPRAATERDTTILGEAARSALAGEITARVAPDGTLRACMLSPDALATIRESMIDQGGRVQLQLDPALAAELRADAEAKLGADVHVLVTDADVRRHVSALLRTTLPDVTVVSHADLTPATQIKAVSFVGP